MSGIWEWLLERARRNAESSLTARSRRRQERLRDEAQACTAAVNELDTAPAGTAVVVPRGTLESAPRSAPPALAPASSRLPLYDPSGRARRCPRCRDLHPGRCPR